MNDQERYPDPSEIRHQIGPNGQLTVNNVSGEIEIRATDGDEAVVVARSENGRADWLPLVVRKSDGALSVDVEKKGPMGVFGSFFGGNDDVSFEISVPRAARLTVNAVSADITSHFLAGEQSYKTVSGDVEVHPDGGRVRVTTVSGDIEVRAAEPIELNASSTSGDVEIAGALVSALEVRTVSGDIKFEAGLAAGPLHTIETISGDLEISSTTGVTVDVKSSMDLGRDRPGMFVAGDGAAQLRFRTLSGDCHVEGARREERDRDRKHNHGRRDRDERRMERQFERAAQRAASQAERVASQVQRHAERLSRRFANDDTSAWDIPNAPMPPMPPTVRPPTVRPPVPAAPPRMSQLEILQALERGEIDVEEANRRLQEA